MEQAPDVTEEEGTSSGSKRGGFALTENDKKIFHLIYEFRFLRREHITALVGRHPKSVHRRLFKLAATGYLAVIRLPLQKHIYALGKKAVPILVEQGRAQPQLLAARLRTRELKELFLKHEMMLVDFHFMLACASRRPEAPLELGHWQEGRELWDHPVSCFGRQGQTTLPFRPDAMFSLIDRRRNRELEGNFFLEADRSSEGHPMFTEKILAYWNYHEQRRHVKKFDIETFRVLTVTLTDARADNLCRMTAAIPTSQLPERARKYFLYTSLQALGDGAGIFDSIYYSAQDPSVRKPLIPPPQPPQTITGV
jgi:hypothetical protein